MITTARINGDKIYKLVGWESSIFIGDPILYIQGSDLADIKETFADIQIIEIFKDSTLVGTYTCYDTFTQITYLGNMYVDGEQIFAEAMSVTLSKTNLVDQVNRIDHQINPVIDLDSMSTDELRTYILEQVSKACEADVYDGQEIELEDGTTQKFSYTFQDQVNWDELFIMAIIAPEMELLPYHGNSHSCTFFTRRQVINICSTLLLRKTQLITYANAINMYANSLEDRDEIMAITYGMELPSEYQENIDQIMSGTIAQMRNFLARIMPEEANEE